VSLKGVVSALPSVERRDDANDEDEGGHREDENCAATPSRTRKREIHGGKIERPSILGPEVVVALVECRVDRIAEQDRSGKLKLALMDEHVNVRRKWVRAVAHTPQFDWDSLGSEACR